MNFTLKQARQYAGLTQAQMAEKLDICRDTYIKYEKSPDLVTIHTAKFISKIVGIPYDSIFGELALLKEVSAKIKSEVE